MILTVTPFYVVIAVICTSTMLTRPHGSFAGSRAEDSHVSYGSSYGTCRSSELDDNYRKDSRAGGMDRLGSVLTMNYLG